jgi:hypothetical protein
VFGLPGRSTTLESRALAEVFAIQEGARTDSFVAIAGFTALALRGLLAERDTIELVESGDAHRRTTDVVVHQSKFFERHDIEVVNGVPVVSAAFAIAQVSGRMTEYALRALVRDSVRQAFVSLDALHEVVLRCGAACTRQFKLLSRIIDERRRLEQSERSESILEERFVGFLVSAGIVGYALQYEVEVRGRVRRLDIAFPERHFAIEIDGFGFHNSLEQFHDDRRRDLELRLLDWDILRVTAKTTRDEFIAAVHVALGQRWHGSALPRIDRAAGHRPHGGRRRSRRV